MLGMGTFGTALAMQLSRNGCRVTGVDSQRERLEPLKEVLHEAVIGDATDRELLENLSVREAQCVFISLGEAISQSLLASLHVKELGAREVIVKGVTREHGKILEYLGVDKVVFPEEEMARQLADKKTWTHVLESVPIDPEYAMAEIAIPSSLNGKTLAEADLTNRFGVQIMMIKDVLTGKFTPVQGGQTRLIDDQIVLVLGKPSEIQAVAELR